MKTITLIVVSIVALAAIAVPYYFLNKHPNQKVIQNSAKEVGERDEEMFHCLAEVEAAYVADVEREYTDAQLHSLLNHTGVHELSPEIRQRIEQKKETSANNCRKDFGPTVSPAASP